MTDSDKVPRRGERKGREKRQKILERLNSYDNVHEGGGLSDEALKELEALEREKKYELEKELEKTKRTAGF